MNRSLESGEGSETKAHGNRFRPEVRALKAGRMCFRDVQLVVNVDGESRPSTDALKMPTGPG